MSESYVALTEQLAQIKAQEEAIQAQLAAERETVRTGLIESLKAHIEKYGFTVEDIATAMLPKRRGTGTGKRKSSGVAKLRQSTGIRRPATLIPKARCPNG